jgi:ATP-dependent Clp protease adaptor protein ClpS
MMADNGHSPDWKGGSHEGGFRHISHTLPKAGALQTYPSMYSVVMLDDDYTPMDFVVFVLERVFHMPAGEAHTLMLRVHKEGQAVCGSFTREVAETKVMQVIDFARANEYPLKCIMHKSGENVIKKP